MFARNRYGMPRCSPLSFGLKSANTLSCVSSVSRLFRSSGSYSPAHLKVLPAALSSPAVSTLWSCMSATSDSRKSSPTTAIRLTSEK